ncbi:MAG TPA: transcription termination factor NusA [Chitinophagales bacterium]|nr:transcription termination factor NusA [Chitinophagales bacterium]
MATNSDLVISFSDFKELKNIDRPTLMKVLDDVFRTLLRKKYGSDENFDIIVNTDKGDLEIWRKREIVPDGEVDDPNTQIAYSNAIKIEEDFEVGEEMYDQINIHEFGRRAILSARQTLMSRITELQKDDLHKKYSERVGEIVTGEVYQVWNKEILVLDDEENELVLPKNETIPVKDKFKKGDTVKAIVKKVEMRNGITPKIILSRTANTFLEKLLELEVPEIFDNIILVKRIAREPGERAKIAVESTDERIDPVGACVGMKGARIHGIVRELGNENIDIINFTNNAKLFIQRALTPAKVVSIDIDENAKRAVVYLKPDQVSLAIGKGGVNIKLACKLTGYEIDVYRDVEEEEYDIELDEFADEIEPWVIAEFKKIGLDTARSVLDVSAEDLTRRTDLEEETVYEVINILRAEFEDEE